MAFLQQDHHPALSALTASMEDPIPLGGDLLSTPVLVGPALSGTARAAQFSPRIDLLGSGRPKQDNGDTDVDEELGGDEVVDSADEEDTLAAAESTVAQSLTQAQKKRADYDAFDTWLAQNRGELEKAVPTAADVFRDEDKTSATLVREFESAKIIESPRDYQVELFEKAKSKNTIAVLDTGSGKTLIAALLLRHTIEQELEDRQHGQPHRVSFFLVDKVALVFQQHAVLEYNLDYAVAKFSGETTDARMSSAEFWDMAIKTHMVVVCTADILLQCLYHSRVCMDQINLLIFDEAHHAKKNHPYARIIKDFYPTSRGCKASKLPRVFGMTASPVDARTNVAQAALELETLLHSEIATIAETGQILDAAKPKTERVVRFHMVLRSVETGLTERLRLLVGDHKFFAKNFQYVRENLQVLGPWMIDRFWQILFRTEELAKHEAKAGIATAAEEGAAAVPFHPDNAGEPGLPGDTSVQYSSNVAAVREASRQVRMHDFVPPTMSILSNKVKRLHETLVEEFTKQNGTSTRCIVFVEQRYTALLLADLLQSEHMMIPNLRPGVLIGGGSTDLGRNSFRTQLLTISKFKRGLTNCLFATSVAEEGIDIPDCNLVIRFDLYRTMIQYIQSRGRARHQESIYIHMAEYGSLNHSRLLTENKMSENKMREFCNALPDDRKLKDLDFGMDYILRDEADQPSFQVPSTKATLTYRSSLVVLSRYVSTLPEPTEGALKAEFSIFGSLDGYVCEVSLPSSSPIRHAVGQPHSRKQVAKCAAAFAICLKLFQKKYIDKHLNPIFTCKLPSMRNARLAVSSKKQATYKMRVKPSAWSALGLPEQLFATLVLLRTPQATGRKPRPLVLLTRVPVPPLPDFPLFFGEGRTSYVHCVPLAEPLRPTRDELDIITAFTIRAFQDVFSKEYEGTAADMPYFFGPCMEPRHDSAANGDSKPRSVLNWDVIRHVASQTERVPCNGDEEDAFFVDKFVSDPFDGSRKFFMRRVRRDLSPFDPEPDGAPSPKHRAWTRSEFPRDILNYSVSLWSRSRARAAFREDQPVVEAEIVIQRRNLLDDRVHLDNAQTRLCYLVLDTLRISPIPADTAAMLFNLPPIIHRVESTLIALEATAVLGLLNIPPSLALEAVTKDCDNPDDVAGGEEGKPLNFQAGMGQNYERLELLGDSFLKMASTIALFTVSPDKDEFEYHVERMCIICNKNLFNNALEARLQEYIRSREFDRSWYPSVVEESDKAAPTTAQSDPQPDAKASTEQQKPPSYAEKEQGRPKVEYGLVLKRGRRQKPNDQHALSDKSIADVCEAMIGAAYLTTYKKRSFDLAVQAVTAVTRSKHHTMQTYKEYYEAYAKPEWQMTPATAAQVHLARVVAQEVGYTFRYPKLLRSAVMHPSYPRHYENLPNYQRLEFLGDALFDMAAVDYLFHKYPNKDPQWLTEHKMAMVSNQFLGVLSVSLGFHRHLLSFSGDLQKQIMEYVARVEDARATAEAEAVQSGRPAHAFARDYWVLVERPVKVVADVLEAYIGAVFVDSGYDYYGAVLPFFERHVVPYFEDVTLYDTFANKHPVTFAVNLLSQRFGCCEWRAVVQETPDNTGDGCVTFATKVAAGFLVHGRVIGHGLAESSRYARIAAAKQALAKLENLSVESFHVLTGCDCRDEAESGEKGPKTGAANGTT